MVPLVLLADDGEVGHAVRLEVAEDAPNVTNKPPKSLPEGAEPSVENMLDDDTSEPLMQRGDDTKEALADRLKNYHAQTVPILAHYEPTGAVVKANANQPMDDVWASCKTALGIAE